MGGKNVLVTGANGFLGRAIISRFVTSDIPVRATDMHPASHMSGIVYRKADITRKEELKSIIENSTTVIHAAGLAHVFTPNVANAESFRRINEVGTANVASTAAAAGVQHFILISSVSVYGPYTQGMYDENTPCRPVGPYAHSKYNAELRAIQIARESGIALTILRLTTLYGENDPGNVGRLMRMMDGGRFIWIGDGSNRKSILYKGDAARACKIVASNPNPRSIINIYNVSAPPCRMRDIVEGLSQALGKKPLPGRIPASTAKQLCRWLSIFPSAKLKHLNSTIDKWLAEDVYDTSQIGRDYNFHTEVSLKEGIMLEVGWYRQKQQNARFPR